MKTTITNFKNGIKTIFPNDKEVMGAVISVTYMDGSFDSAAILPQATDDVWYTNTITDLLSHATTALLNSYYELPSALEKLGTIIS